MLPPPPPPSSLIVYRLHCVLRGVLKTLLLLLFFLYNVEALVLVIEGFSLNECVYFFEYFFRWLKVAFFECEVRFNNYWLVVPLNVGW